MESGLSGTAGVADGTESTNRNGVFSVGGKEHQVDIGVGEGELGIAHDARGDGSNPGAFTACRSEGETGGSGREGVDGNAAGRLANEWASEGVVAGQVPELQVVVVPAVKWETELVLSTISPSLELTQRPFWLATAGA